MTVRYTQKVAGSNSARLTNHESEEMGNNWWNPGAWIIVLILIATVVIIAVATRVWEKF